MNDVPVCPKTSICTFAECKKQFEPKSKRHRFCSSNCRFRAVYLPEKLLAEQRKKDRLLVANARHVLLSRGRAIGFDGRYGYGSR